MPRGQKSKLRSREKRRHVQSEIRSVPDAPATAATMAEEGEPLSSSPPVCDVNPHSSAATSGACTKSQGPQKRGPATPNISGGVTHPKSNRGAKSLDGKRASTSQVGIATGNSCVNPLDQKALLLVQSMLRKYSMRELITKEGMLRYVTRKYKMHFREILQKASDFMGLVFGIFVKEVDPIRHHYALVSQLSQIGEPELNSDDIMLHSGLLMIILCVIFLKGNEASEEDIWEVLNVIGIFAGKSHFILGEPKQLITQDLVQEMYLEYKQVPNSDPPRYGFLWGLRAHTEISKTRVFEVFSKIHNTVPTAFPAWCQSALGDEEERMRARFTDMFPISVQCGVDFNSFSDSRV